MKRTIRLTESELRKFIQSAINEELIYERGLFPGFRGGVKNAARQLKTNYKNGYTANEIRRAIEILTSYADRLDGLGFNTGKAVDQLNKIADIIEQGGANSLNPTNDYKNGITDTNTTSHGFDSMTSPNGIRNTPGNGSKTSPDGIRNTPGNGSKTSPDGIRQAHNVGITKDPNSEYVDYSEYPYDYPLPSGDIKYATYDNVPVSSRSNKRQYRRPSQKQLGIYQGKLPY